VKHAEKKLFILVNIVENASLVVIMTYLDFWNNNLDKTKEYGNNTLDISKEKKPYWRKKLRLLGRY
jgi:hypothetical protein